MALPGAHLRVPAVPIALVVLALVLVSAGFASASAPDGRVRGYLKDSVSGAPIIGASVRIDASDLPWVFEATSDPSGYFDVAVPPHRYTLRAWDPAHLRNMTGIAVGSGLTIWSNMTLTPASARTARVEGVVTDSVPGQPVTVGRIVAGPPSWVGSGTYQNGSALNATGGYVIDLVPGSYEISTDDVIGYAPYSDYPVTVFAGQTLWYNISLTPNPLDAWINGTVRDAGNSTPIPFATVTADVDGLQLPSVTADASGFYSVNVPSGTVTLAADAAGYAPATTSIYAWGSGTYYQDVYLQPLSLYIVGYIHDGVTGEPMVGITVTVDPLFFTGYSDIAVTNSSGFYAVPVPDDYYVVAARPPGYTVWSSWIISFSGRFAWANGTVWPIISTISGYLTDATDGSPVSGLVVAAIDIRTSYSVTATADSAGFFTFQVPPSPAMSVWAYGGGPYAGNVAYVGTRPYETTWVNMTLARLSAQIVANVTDALTGLPISGASVIAAWYFGSQYAATNATGLATVGAPVGVTVYVTAVASGYNFWTDSLVPVAGENPVDIRLFPDLPQDVRIRGYVTDSSSGLGIWSASVEAITGYDLFPPWDYTDSSGYYELYTVAAPQTVHVTYGGYTAGEAAVSPASGEEVWLNFTLTPDSVAPQILGFTATPTTGLDETHPTALRADVSESRLDRADLSILKLHSAAANVGTFVNLGNVDPSTVAVTEPSPGSYGVASSWDTRTPVGRISDRFSSYWWPILLYGGPFLAIVNGYFDDASLASPIPANAVFDARDGRFLFVITTSGFVGPLEEPTATFAPYTLGTKIDLTNAAVLGATLVQGSALRLGSLHLDVWSSVPSGTYAALLTTWDSSGQYDQAAVLLQTAADTVPPVADAGSDRTVDEDASVTFDGSASSDNLGIASYTWTFVDGSPQTLTGVTPSYVFATPGIYVITLTVRDADGNVGIDTFIVTVRDVTVPRLSVTSPSEGSTVTGTLHVTANATDNVGVVRVELFVDGTSAGTDVAAPFEFTVSAAVGNHTLEIVAIDGAGNSASEVRHVTIVSSSEGAPLLPAIVVFGGLILFVLIALAVAVLILLRRRPRRPATMPAAPATAPAMEQTPAPQTEAPPVETPTEFPDIDSELG